MSHISDPTARNQAASRLRAIRRWHRQTGLVLLLFFSLVATTGLLLGWKKVLGGPLAAEAKKGSTTSVQHWLPLHQLAQRAADTLQRQLGSNWKGEIEKLEVRPAKGSVRAVFNKGFWEVQLDGATGAVLVVQRRYGDVVMKIHDGSILDRYIKTGSPLFKLLYTALTALALLLMCASGYWLWYGPKKLRSGPVA